MIKLLFLLLLNIVIVLGQSSNNDDAASSSSCYSNLDEISMKELEISIHRRNKTTTPWITSVEEQEEQQEQQGVVDDVPVELRRYILCPNTTFTIGTPLEDDPNEQDAFYVYEGGSIPLLVINPNMELWCGHDGNVNNNCVLDGGEYQIVSSKVLMPPALRDITYHVNPTNFTIRGVTMRGSTYRSVQMGELGQDYGILFQNCIFEQQHRGKFVIYIQTLGMNVMGGIESTAQAQEQDEEEEEAAQEEEDSTGRQLRRNKNRRRRRHLQDEQQQQQQSGPSDTIGEPDEIVTLPADEEEESNNNNNNSTTTTTTTEETADEDQHVNVGAAIQNASQQLQQQQEEEEEENGQEENGPAQLLGEPDPTLPPTQIPAEQQQQEDQQQQSDGPALGELDPTLPPTQLPAEQQQQQDASNMIATTTSSSVPMNPLSGIIELASSTSNLLQITFDGCLFRNNIVEHAIMGINDAVELYLSNNIFLNNTVGKKTTTTIDENENGEDTTTFFRDSSIIELNDPLPSLYVENNCWMNNTYGASPLLLEHGTLSQEGFEELDLSENVNGNHVELVVNNDDNMDMMIYCPNQMLVIAPSQDDLLQINSPSLNERLDRGAYICVDMDIRQECMASIYEPDMMMDDTTNNNVDTSASNNNNVDSSSSSSNNNASKSIKVTVILLTGSFLLFGIGFLCWTSARRQKVQREEYINRVLQDHAQP